VGRLKENLDILQRKAKERTVKTQNIEYDLETLVKKIGNEVIQLNPDYQRNHRWSDDVSSRLIESLILNIPIPLVYISQDIDVDADDEEGVARYSVIDGQQRLTAIFNFFKNEYPLSGLDVLRELNGSYYRDLPPFLIRRLEERTIKCLRIDSTVDSQVKYDIFERLNSGAVKLEAQELRNATRRGPFKDLLKQLSKNEDFIAIAQLDPEGARVRKMEDEELVLRFFALCFENGYEKYRGGFRDFLTYKMDEFNTLSPEKLKGLSALFQTTMQKIRSSFGDFPFSKFRFEDGQYSEMSKFNAAVFDAVVVAFASLTPEKESSCSYEVFKELFRDSVFFNAVEGSVNDVSKLNQRIALACEVIH
jgi:hypothetical protein